MLERVKEVDKEMNSKTVPLPSDRVMFSNEVLVKEYVEEEEGERGERWMH